MSIKEIARRTGLSVPTVGNVLGRAAHRYSPETRQRILEAARELGYRPNSSARAMRQGRIGCAALVLSRSKQQTHSNIPLGLLDGIDSELAQHNMHLAVSRLSDQELSSDSFLPKVLREYMADGMIVNYTHEIPPRMLELIHAHNAPAVWVNAKLGEDCVYPDDYNAARSATIEFIKRGHRRLAFLHMISPYLFPSDFEASRPRWHYSAADRAAGYFDALRESGLPARVTYHDRYVPDGEQMNVCRALLSGPDRPTAVLVYSEAGVPQLLCAAAEAGLSIPRDLSVMAFAPSDLMYTDKPVTAVRVPTAEMGRRAVKMLMRKIAGPDTCCNPEPVPYLAEPGATVAPPPPAA